MPNNQEPITMGLVVDGHWPVWPAGCSLQDSPQTVTASAKMIRFGYLHKDISKTKKRKEQDMRQDYTPIRGATRQARNHAELNFSQLLDEEGMVVMVSSGDSVFVSICLSCLEEVSLVSEE
jgi:hypothetical protein